MLDLAKTISVFQKESELQSVKAGEVIFSPGEPGEVMYGVIEGEVHLSIHDHTVEVIGAGDIFGAGAIVGEDNIRITKAVAATDTKLAHLNKLRFLFLLEENPMFALNVIKSIYGHLREVKKLLEAKL